MTISIDSVCTEAELADALGTASIDSIGLRPRGWDTCEPARQQALDSVLSRLRGRTPPIRDTDLSDVTELRPAVIQGAKMTLYELAMTSATDGALFLEKWRMAEKRFRAEIDGLNPTLIDGLRGPSRSFSFARR